MRGFSPWSCSLLNSLVQVLFFFFFQLQFAFSFILCQFRAYNGGSFFEAAHFQGEQFQGDEARVQTFTEPLTASHLLMSHCQDQPGDLVGGTTPGLAIGAAVH